MSQLVTNLNGNSSVPLVVAPKKEYDFKVCVAYCVHREMKVKVFQIARLLEKCPNPKIDIKVVEGDALIDRSRSRAATKFLETDYDILLYLDDDIFFDAVELTRMLWEMWQKDLDIIGAGYITKEADEPSFTFRTRGDQNIVFGNEGGIHEVRWLATGCMAVRRRVIEKMVDSETVHLCNRDTINFYPFFMPFEKLIDGKWNYLSEDYAFCERANELGFKCWVDSRMKLTHFGNYLYDWDDIHRPRKQKAENLLCQFRIVEE